MILDSYTQELRVSALARSVLMGRAVPIDVHPPVRSATLAVRGDHARLVGCFIRASQLDAEGAKLDARRADHRPLLRRHVESARELVVDTLGALALLQHCPAEEPRRDSGIHTKRERCESSFESLLGEDEQESDPAADLAFVSAGQLRRELASLPTSLDDAPLPLLADLAASAIRKVFESTASVEAALAANQGTSSRIDVRPLVERSLAARRAYTAFRLTVGALESDDERAIAKAADAIDELLTGPSIADVRWSDRAVLASLSGRMRLWLAGRAEEHETATRLLGDLSAVCQVLAYVGDRYELVEHDLRVLPALLVELERLIDAGRTILRGHLEKVRGMDDDLETMLAPGRELDAHAIVAQLRHAYAARLRAAGVPTGTPET